MTFNLKTTAWHRKNNQTKHTKGKPFHYITVVKLRAKPQITFELHD